MFRTILNRIGTACHDHRPTMTTDSDAVSGAKAALRETSRRRRDQLDESARAQAAAALAQHSAALSVLAGAEAVFSSYRAIGTECDPVPLESALTAAGHTISLPVIRRKGEPLLFRRWQPGDPLVTRAWGIREPDASAAAVEPDVLLLPLLAFDAAGWRLGYGGGFYDRTLARLRARKPIIAIGLAFATQEVDAVPHSAYDERLDWILAPEGLRAMQNLDA